MTIQLFDYEAGCDAHAINAAGVYAILDEDHYVMYVGETNCFIDRWGDHCKGRGTAIPRHEIFRFVILCYEDDRDERLYLEQQYQWKLGPKYGGRGYHLRRRTSSNLDHGKLASLGRRGLVSPYDPSPPIEEPEEALEAELRHLSLD